MSGAPIKFWRTTDEYGALSNFSRHSVLIDDKVWPTTEHFYQAMKAQNENDREAIRTARSPKLAKDKAHEIALREGWDKIKFDVMRRALFHKAEQHPEIRYLLRKSGDAELIEDSPYDSLWGCGSDGKGQNWLGKLWMEVRNSLSPLLDPQE